jgi:hypothetical protein
MADNTLEPADRQKDDELQALAFKVREALGFDALVKAFERAATKVNQGRGPRSESTVGKLGS